MNGKNVENGRYADLSADELSRVDGGLAYGELPTLQFSTQETMLASFFEVKDQPRTATISILPR